MWQSAGRVLTRPIETLMSLLWRHCYNTPWGIEKIAHAAKRKMRTLIKRTSREGEKGRETGWANAPEWSVLKANSLRETFFFSPLPGDALQFEGMAGDNDLHVEVLWSQQEVTHQHSHNYSTHTSTHTSHAHLFLNFTPTLVIRVCVRASRRREKR